MPLALIMILSRMGCQIMHLWYLLLVKCSLKFCICIYLLLYSTHHSSISSFFFFKFSFIMHFYCLFVVLLTCIFNSSVFFFVSTFTFIYSLIIFYVYLFTYLSNYLMRLQLKRVLQWYIILWKTYQWYFVYQQKFCSGVLTSSISILTSRNYWDNFGNSINSIRISA